MGDAAGGRGPVAVELENRYKGLRAPHKIARFFAVVSAGSWDRPCFKFLNTDPARRTD